MCPDLHMSLQLLLSKGALTRHILMENSCFFQWFQEGFGLRQVP